MGLRGPTRKANNIKLLEGTSRQDRMIDPLAVDGEVFSELPPFPGWLSNQHAIDEWLRLGPVLVRCKMLNAGNLICLAMLCRDLGNAIDGDDKSASRYQKWMSDFGLTPASRGRLKLNAPKDDKPQGFSKFQRAA